MRTEIDPEHLSPLFADHKALRAVIEAVLEGRLGRTVVGSGVAAARLDVGCYSIFGGEPDPRLAAGVERPKELIYADPEWRACLLEVHRGQVRQRPMVTFASDRLDEARLRELAERPIAGYSVRRLDAAGARQLDDALIPHGLQTYADAAAFAARGLGYGAFADGRLACAATSYAMSAASLEIAISTRPDHRGRSLATATAARLILECLARRLEPCWTAANPVSQRLATRLGFRPAGVCEALYLDGSSADEGDQP